jgi:hypothetical protein
MLNPNNAAALINIALVPSVLLVHKIRRALFVPLSAILFLGLLCTESKGGLVGLTAGIGAYMFFTYGWKVKFGISTLLACTPLLLLLPAFAQRVEIWSVSTQLITLKGYGHGMFGKLYPYVRTEKETLGHFAHNDILQFAIEMGWPIAALFVGICAYITVRTREYNLIPACAMLSILVCSMVSFPFYVPAVSIGMGVLLRWWLDLCEKHES